MTVTITTLRADTLVTSPRNDRFAAKAEARYARWTGAHWIFPPTTSTSEVRAICRDCYGTDGTPAGATVIYNISELCAAIHHTVPTGPAREAREASIAVFLYLAAAERGITFGADWASILGAW